jgi:hypothetical protein
LTKTLDMGKPIKYSRAADIKIELAPDKRTSLTLNYAAFNSYAALQLFSNCIGLT